MLERVAVWTHVLLILGFLIYLPYSKHLHILVAAINVFFTRTRRRGRLEPIDFEQPEADVRFGAATASDLTWKQLLDTMSCTECGRCQDVCPAYNTGKELSPKLLIMALRDQVRAQSTAALVPNAVTDNVVWDCVTCGACVQECPVGIEHIDHIVDLRRNLVMVESRFPEEAGAMLRDALGQAAGGPHRLGGRPRRARAAARRGPARGAVLGRVRAGVRRAREAGRAIDGEALEAGRCGLRDPRPA